jgi:hypothetical protein
MRSLFSSTTFARIISCPKKNGSRYETYIGVQVISIFIKVRPVGGRFFPHRRMDTHKERYDEANSLYSQFC